VDFKKRQQNERDFTDWIDIENGGRKYWFEIIGRKGGRARYIKVADANEATISFVQEIYDANNRLIEIHEKYPVDKRHKKLEQ